MTTLNKVLVTLLAAAVLTAAAFYFLWRSTAKDLAACKTEAGLYAANVEAQRKTMAIQIGNLEADRDKWRERAASGTDTALDPKVVTIVKQLPPDCQQCATSWVLDRNYANPGPNPPPGTIKVRVEDVLVTDRATWEIDTARLCPACPPATPGPGNTPGKPGGGRVWGALAEGAVGYGLAGPEAEVALYPTVVGDDRWEVQFGGRAHANLQPTGEIVGNALLEVRVGRRGQW